MQLGSFTYASSEAPPGYSCMECGAVGVRLWRDVRMTAERMVRYCFRCACAIEQPNQPPGWITHFLRGHTHCIGSYVPCVPVEEGTTYYMATEIPRNAYVWWENLPLQAAQSVS